MHAEALLHKSFEKSAQEIHKKRLDALFVTVECLLWKFVGNPQYLVRNLI
jgi:hypothetical protein